MLIDIMLVILILIGVVLVVLLFYMLFCLIGSEIYYTTLKYKTHTETVTVLGKKFKPAYTSTTYVRAGKVTIPQTHHHTEKHDVYVDYEGETYCINDNDLFKKVEIGESIEVTVNEGYNRKGQVKNIYLTPKKCG